MQGRGLHFNRLTIYESVVNEREVKQKLKGPGNFCQLWSKTQAVWGNITIDYQFYKALYGNIESI